MLLLNKLYMAYNITYKCEISPTYMKYHRLCNVTNAVELEHKNVGGQNFMHFDLHAIYRTLRKAQYNATNNMCNIVIIVQNSFFFPSSHTNSYAISKIAGYLIFCR